MTFNNHGDVAGMCFGNLNALKTLCIFLKESNKHHLNYWSLITPKILILPVIYFDSFLIIIYINSVNTQQLSDAGT